MKSHLLPLVCLALLFPAFAGAQQASTRPVYQKLKPCKVQGLDEEILCGTMSVWENRTARSGRKIDLYMAVLPALSPSPAPDPVFYINGGPGYGSAGGAAGMAQFLADIRKQRDIVLLDQRGIGKSHPLHCELPGGESDLQGYMRTLFPMAALKTCEPKLAAQADLTQYTTEIAMDDLDDVRAWLGYERINVFGGSYGTRAAQAYMRQHPDHVRSAILTGVMIMDARMPFYHARKAQESIDKLFDDCAADESCRAAFPDLRGDLAKAVARLAQGPVKQTVKAPKTGQPVELSIPLGAFTTTLRAMQYNAFLSARIPLYVHLAAQGDYGPMMLMTVLDRTDPDWDIGAYLSITCAEDVARIDPKEVPALIANTYQGDDRIRDQVEACSFWPRARVSEGFFKPVESLAPTLILTGWLDPATPPEWAVEVQRHLPNSLNVVIRDGGHGPGGLSHAECYPKLLSDFIANGTPFGLDTSCVKEMKRPAFLLKDEPFPGN
ncbi:MAG TPA: alpha/beta fold hydrolase [Thermoanaerobaculia bacterium]|jgi:pimeloyl-ACP methyl ester carboxylesterase|nr:alpha/beta fold hydrolase [Thermoanaerobaculia bacterium]